MERNENAMVEPDPYKLGEDDAEPADGFPGIPNRKHRPPPNDSHAVEIKLRVDAEVMAAFKADSPGWESRMNDALRRAAGLE